MKLIIKPPQQEHVLLSKPVIIPLSMKGFSLLQDKFIRLINVNRKIEYLNNNFITIILTLTPAISRMLHQELPIKM